jgi:hypothetical protein
MRTGRPTLGGITVVTLSKAKRRVQSTTGDARDRVGPVAGSARDSVASALDETRQRVSPALSDAGAKLGSALEDAKVRIAPALGEAKEKVGPALEETRDRIGPLLEDARSRVVPVAQQAIAESRRKGRSAAVKLGIAEEPKKTHKFRNLLVLLGISGAGLFLYKKFFGRTETWSDAGGAPATSAPRSETTGAPNASVAAAATEAAKEATEKVAEKASAVKAKVESKINAKASSAKEPKDQATNNETAPTAPLASEETVASHEPTTPDNPLEETKIDEPKIG